jgi:hypothetical protein
MDTEGESSKEVKRGENETDGEAGIRTLETIAGLLVFETSPIDHSGTSPALFICQRLAHAFRFPMAN